MPVSLPCTAVPWQTGCRTSLHESAKFCRSPLSQGLQFSLHTVLCSGWTILWSTFTGIFYLQYLGMCTVRSILQTFFFRLFLLPTLLYRYRMEIKDICLRAIKDICLKTVMSQIPTQYFRVLLWSPIHLSQSELPFLLSPRSLECLILASLLPLCSASLNIQNIKLDW